MMKTEDLIAEEVGLGKTEIEKRDIINRYRDFLNILEKETD